MIEIAKIKTDGGTQPRDSINDEVVEEYAEAMVSGATFPSVTVFYDGQEYWLADGFHRVGAAKKAGRTEIEAQVHQGSRDDAIDYACSAAPNSRHGLREKPEDRHRRVATMLRKHPDWSNVQLGEHCGVSRETVRRVSQSIMHNVQDRPPERTVTRNGTTYTQNTENIGRRPEATENPEDAESPGDPETEPENEYVFDEWSDDGSDDGSDDEEADDHNNRPRGEDADSGGSRDTQSDRSKRTWQRAHGVVHEIESENTKKSNPWEILGLSSAEQIAESFELEWLEVTRNLTAKVRHDAANKLLVFFRNQTIELNRMAAS